MELLRHSLFPLLDHLFAADEAEVAALEGCLPSYWTASSTPYPASRVPGSRRPGPPSAGHRLPAAASGSGGAAGDPAPALDVPLLRHGILLRPVRPGSASQPDRGIAGSAGADGSDAGRYEKADFAYIVEQSALHGIVQNPPPLFHGVFDLTEIFHHGYPAEYKRLECPRRQMVDLVGLVDWLEAVTHTAQAYEGIEMTFEEATGSSI